MDRPSPLVSGATLAVLAVVFCGMAFWGIKQATAPVASDYGASANPTCSAEETSVQRYVKRGEVVVSVYNSGKTKGLATDVLQRLEGVGFKAGAVGNAPEELSADLATVYSKNVDSTAAKLVAAIFGPDTQVLPLDADLGPGVNVVVGDQFKKLDRSAPRRMKLAKPVTTCVKVE